MRLFLNAGIYPAYLKKLSAKYEDLLSFRQRRQAFLVDRFGASHLLSPILDGDESAFFSVGDAPFLQEMWALENGMRMDRPLDEILLAQIEHHRAEVFYNLDPMRYGSDFVRKLPGCVRKTIAWRAAPSPGADFSGYDMVVCNFPVILESYRQRGWRAEYFSPAHDPEMDAYAANNDRPIDVLFVGGYSRHHRRRAQVLETVARQSKHMSVVFHLDRSRLTRLAESPLGRLLPLSDHRRPLDIQAITTEPVFGRDLYAALSRAKIVLNGAVDMAGEDRGNMRCFEALGCAALMLSDHGRYPGGFVDKETMLAYRNADEAAELTADILANWWRGKEIAAKGWSMIRNRYSKAAQWERFLELVE